MTHYLRYRLGSGLRGSAPSVTPRTAGPRYAPATPEIMCGSAAALLGLIAKPLSVTFREPGPRTPATTCGQRMVME